MDTKIFIPKKIKIGYNKRSDTYTGFLGFVIYYDEKGKLRQETSWKSWIEEFYIDSNNQKIVMPIDDYDNVPTSGFVLNKKVGDYKSDWNHRKAHIRIYDPRGFEFEISPENLLYILENTNSIKGKGLEGDFVYGWQGKDLILLPVDSPDYQEIVEFTNLRISPDKITTKDLILGATYKTNMNEDWIYMGKFEAFEEYGYNKVKKGVSLGNKYFFYNGRSFFTQSGTSGKISRVVSDQCVSNYSELMEKLESCEIFSPHDKNLDEYILCDFDYILSIKDKWNDIYVNVDGDMFLTRIYHRGYDNNKYVLYNLYEEPRKPNQYWASYGKDIVEYNKASKLYYWYKEKFPNLMGTIEELFSAIQFYKKVEYLKNKKELKNGK